MKNDDITKLFTKRLCEQYHIFPLGGSDSGVLIASNDPENLIQKDKIEDELGQKVQLEYRDSESIKVMISQHYASSTQLDTSAMIEAHDIELVFLSLMAFVHANTVTDVHIEAGRNEGKIRVRVDGVLEDIEVLDITTYKRLVTYLKVKAGMDITETRLPQDGQFSDVIEDKKYDLRLSTMPTLNGEKVMMRILSTMDGIAALEALGYSSSLEEKLEELLQLPAGLVIVAGPTGAGKTTTLFSMLSKLNSPERNIITIEDPIEYQLDGINQVEVKPRANLTFSTIARTVLRQDPDIVLMGEVRDRESAEVAIQNALTGTLFFTTIHAKNTVGTISRLINLGIEAHWIAASLSAVLAQRLVRTICDQCVETYTPSETLLAQFNLKKKRYKRGKGCIHCRGIGYKGRTTLAELLIVNDEVSQAVSQFESPYQFKKIAREHGFFPFTIDAKEKIEKGVTTVEEVLRVIPMELD
jgi:type II secretory ATPase GspE/PulE/Tfp pilus assembly ATPase PilB-like protein